MFCDFIPDSGEAGFSQSQKAGKMSLFCSLENVGLVLHKPFVIFSATMEFK